jgi:hypothetical protein
MNTVTPAKVALGILITALSISGVSLTATPAWAQFGSGGDTSVTRRPYNYLEGRIVTDRTNYASNRAVQITLSLTNLSNQRHSFATGKSPLYDVTVKDGRTNKVVYRASNHRNVPRGVNYTLVPEDTRTYRELWDQRDDSGNRVPPGVYIIEGAIYPQGTASTQVYLSDSGRPTEPGRPGEPGDSPGRPGDPNVPGRPAPGGRLSSTLQASRTRVQPGDTVTLTYTVLNRGEVPVTLPFSSSQRFDMTATGPQGRTVWQQSQDMMYAQALGQLELGPGQRQTFTARWQVDKSARPGAYNVIAFLTPRNTGSGAVSKAPAALNVIVGSGSPSYGNSGNTGAPDTGMGTAPSATAPIRIVGPSVLAGPQGRSLVGQRVMVSGTYQGLKGGAGAPPARRSDWVLSGEGVTLYVSGSNPTTREGSPVTITGYVRQAADGRLYIESL